MSQLENDCFMPEERALHIFKQIAYGLRDMHAVGLVHRDLKLLNIFMCDTSDEPRVKIGDLGLAVYLPPGASLIKRAGTIAFMAPEVMTD